MPLPRSRRFGAYFGWFHVVLVALTPFTAIASSEQCQKLFAERSRHNTFQSQASAEQIEELAKMQLDLEDRGGSRTNGMMARLYLEAVRNLKDRTGQPIEEMVRIQSLKLLKVRRMVPLTQVDGFTAFEPLFEPSTRMRHASDSIAVALTPQKELIVYDLAARKEKLRFPITNRFGELNKAVLVHADRILAEVSGQIWDVDLKSGKAQSYDLPAEWWAFESMTLSRDQKWIMLSDSRGSLVQGQILPDKVQLSLVEKGVFEGWNTRVVETRVDGQFLFLVPDRGSSLYDVRTGIQTHFDRPIDISLGGSVVFSLDQKYFYFLNKEGLLSRLDMQSTHSRPEQVLGFLHPATRIFPSKDPHIVFVMAAIGQKGNHGFFRYDLEKQEMVRLDERLQIPGIVMSVHYLLEKNQYVVTSMDLKKEEVFVTQLNDEQHTFSQFAVPTYRELYSRYDIDLSPSGNSLIFNINGEPPEWVH